MDKCSSKIHKVHMELGGKLLNSLTIETQFLERLQSVKKHCNTTRLHNISQFFLNQTGISLFLISTALKIMLPPSSNLTQKHLSPT